MAGLTPHRRLANSWDYAETQIKNYIFLTLKISEKRHCEIDQSDEDTIEDLICRYAIEYYNIVIKWSTAFFDRCLCHLDNLNILISHCVFSSSEIVLQNSAEMYSAADYVEMLIIFGECGRNAREAARIFSGRFPDRPSPDYKTILRVRARSQETGKVLPNRNEIGGGARTARTLANEEAILNIVEEDGTRSIREIAQEVDISSRSVHRVLNENRLHPFHYTRVQHLEPEDYPARRNVCVWLLNKAAEDENFISRILFSDESSFGRQGCFNHRNLHVWSYDNPRGTYPHAFQRRFSVNLWSGLVGDSVVSQDCKK
jgi:hypothetical protein